MKVQGQKTIWWVDSLRIKEAWHIYTYSRKEGYTVSEVRYFRRISLLGKVLTKFLLRLRITRANFDMTHSIPNENGNLFWEAWREYTAFGWHVAPNNDADRLLVDEIGPQYHKDTLRLFFRRQICYDQFHNLKLMHLINYYASKEPLAHHAALLSVLLWEKDFKKRTANFSYTLFSCLDQNYWLLIFLRFGQYVMSILKNSFLFIVFKLKDTLKGVPAQAVSPKIGVYYAQGLDTDKKSDVFWLPESDIRPQDVCVYFLNPDEPRLPTKEVIAKLKGLGVGYVSLLSRKKNSVAGVNLDLSTKYFQLAAKNHMNALKVLIGLVKHLGGEKRGIKLWQFERLMWLLGRIALLESFYKAYNIKLHTGFYAEDDQNIIAMDMAVQRSGGIDTYVIWSNLPGPEIMPSIDVYYDWGPHCTYYFEKIGHAFKNFVYVGYPFDRLFNVVAQKAKEHKQQLRNKGAEFVISFYDNAHYEGGWFPKEDLIKIHETLFNRLKKDKTFGLILKPKRLNSLEVVSKSRLKPLMDDLEREGRLLVLKGKELPAEAALASDFAIGYGVFSSAGVECAFTGTKTVLYDPVNQKFDLFYKDGFGSFVFNNFDEIMVSIDNYRKNPATQPSLGDFSFISREIDPFQDQKASLRIAKHMNCLFKEISSGKTKKESIDKANQLYKREFGDQHVMIPAQRQYAAPVGV